MLIPLGMRYTSRVSTVVNRKELCPKCGCSFSYKCKVKAAAMAGSFLFLNNDGARSRASELAKERLDRKISKARAPAPCPQCLHVPTSFVMRGVITLIPLVLLGAFISMMGLAVGSPSKYDTPTPAAQAISPFCTGIGVLIILLPTILFLYRIGLSIPAFRKAALKRHSVRMLAPGYAGAKLPAADTAQDELPSQKEFEDDDNSIPFADSSSGFEKAAPARRAAPVPQSAPRAMPPREPLATKPLGAKQAVTQSASRVVATTNPVTVQKKTASSPAVNPASTPTPTSTISAACGNCGKLFRVSAKFAGKKAKCTGCHAAITIPTA